ncbi:protein-methionine-sulfoxide reductase heme-binding subunit MsrQ [Algihabitans albus]|uniref:sulfite oxidase heme-binding subunit YedZ n=1 Tax=Algihabitans albus TaxID=2164067 RepID=UPI001ABBFCA8|nr:ferric reductase-like transmembrane domain-containing protein [Algihabitans albus]
MVLAVPGFISILGWITDNWTYGEIVSRTGLWSVQLLIATLAVTPLRRLLGATKLTRFLVRRRRDLGVASFGYAALHTGVYLVRKGELQRIVTESQEIWLATGWLAFFIFVILAATSNDASVRALRHNWKRLHASVYIASALVIIHWAMSAFNPTEAYIYVALLLGLQAARFVPRRT